MFKTWLVVLAGSLVLSTSSHLLFPQAAGPDIAAETPGSLFFLVVVTPILETLLMMGPLLLAARFAGPGPAVLGSALLWGILHSLATPTWGLVAWWPFLIMGIAFLTWRPHGLLLAIGLVSAVHALQNGFAALVLLLVAQSAS